MGKGGRRDFCGKKALNRQIFVVGYQPFAERKHLHAALCSNGYGAWTLARKLHRQLSMSGTATPSGYCSTKQFGSSKRDSSLVYPRTRTCWASSNLIFSLTIIKLLQVKSVQIISECPLQMSALAINDICQTLNVITCFSSKEELTYTTKFVYI
jgi:hypothetical protein